MKNRSRAALAGALSLTSFVPALASHAQIGGSAKVAVTATEFKFAPDKWSIPANKDVVVTLQNKGTVDHEFVVLKTAIKKEKDFKKANVLASVGPTKAGKLGAGKIKLAAGTYQVICTITGHFDGGMKGTLTVK